MAQSVSHQHYMNYLVEVGNHPGMKILEVGSREVTGKSDARDRFSKAEYVGFDYYPGPNVDIAGDAHKLSSYFDEQFDIIYSSAVFEHLAMPWVVAGEIAQCLKVNGLVFIETHFSFSSHERPWHFFQFSDMALRVLFSPELGFECIEAGMCNPIIGRFSALADDYLRFKPVTGLYCHSDFLGRKVKEVKHPNWSEFHLEDLVDQTQYPLKPDLSLQNLNLIILPDWDAYIEHPQQLGQEVVNLLLLLSEHTNRFKFSLWIHTGTLSTDDANEVLSSLIFESMLEISGLSISEDIALHYFSNNLDKDSEGQINFPYFRVILEYEDASVSRYFSDGIDCKKLEEYFVRLF